MSVTYRGEFHVAAAAAPLYKALVDRSHLEQWFAERAQIEPVEGGAFRFWGRLTPWLDNASLADGRVRAADPHRQLAFSWTWRETANRVAISLRASDTSTAVAIEHQVEGDMGFGSEAVWMLSDFWTLAMANLRSFLATGRPLLQPDYSDRSGDVVLCICVAAPTRAVWNALTDPDAMNRWIARTATVDCRAGGVYSYGWTLGDSTVPCGPATFLDCVPERMMEHDWYFDHEPGCNGASGERTSVRWELHPIGAGSTFVLLRHRRPMMDDPRLRGGYQLGWGSFLAVLHDFVEAPSVRLREPRMPSLV